MTLPVVVALVVFLALTVGAFVLGACRASRDAQAESRRHVEELMEERGVVHITKREPDGREAYVGLALVDPDGSFTVHLDIPRDAA